jgi:hypothetical protein
MIIREILENGFILTYSDQGFYIHGGSPEADYAEAVDSVERTYTETNIPIDAAEANDKMWISTVDNNVWAPGVYGWEEVTE